MPAYSATEMQAYDTDPLPVSEILARDPTAGHETCVNQRAHKLTRSKGAVLPVKHVQWEKKDVVAKGVYKPWFFTRFARMWIPLGKPQCVMDLKSIQNGSKIMSRCRPKKEKNSVDLEEIWIGCDECSKWRKVPHGFEFDKDKSFFCNMLADTTCETPEEEWDDDEDFVDQDDIIVEQHFSRGSTHIPHSPDKHSESSHDENSSSSRDYARTSRASSRDYTHPRDVTNNSSAAERGPGKRRIISPRGFGADDDQDSAERWKRRRTEREEMGSRPTSSEATVSQHRSAQQRGGAAGALGISRLDAVVLVLRETGKAMHYDVITKLALQQGTIRFTGSQGTAGESMKAFLNKTIRENKSAAIMNMGKGIYGLKEWGRRGTARDKGDKSAAPATSSQATDCAPTPSPSLSSIISPALSYAIQSVPASPSDGKRRSETDEAGLKLPALVLGAPSCEPVLDVRSDKSAYLSSSPAGFVEDRKGTGGSIAALLN